MAAYVKCLFCGQQFNREKEPCIKLGRRYAHTKCAEQQDPSLIQEEKDKERFYEVVKKIYGNKYNYMLINTQATQMIQEYGYTWSGMTACLHWFYNINHGNLEDGNGGIGIIPFIYNEVKEYYQNIYSVQEKNSHVTMRQSVVEFNIQSPRAWSQPPQLLNLEDENDIKER